MNLALLPVSPGLLLFDPNNYRFHDIEGFRPASEQRLHEDAVQRRAYERLKDERLLELKGSILRNGYVPVEQLVVRPYSNGDQQLFVVVEGNRRLAAVRWILEDHSDGGVDVDAGILATLEHLPVVVIEQTGPDEIFRASLMGIRHVSGIREWGGYQRAKLIVYMRDDLELDTGEVAERLGLSSHEVARRYRAYKALEQMQEHEELGNYAKASMYPLFHEAVSIPVVRDWLGWDESESAFQREDELSKFYSLLCPMPSDDERTQNPKITTYIQVRHLRDILQNSQARNSLLDPSRSFDEALAFVKQDELRHQWAGQVSIAISALQRMGIDELKSLSPDDHNLLRKLREIVEERLGDYAKLVSGGE